MGKRSGSGFDITINDWGYGDGHLDLYVQERIPLHPELQMTMPYYPTDTAEINIRPNSVTVHRMDPIYTGDDILPVLDEPLTWKTTSKTFNITELYKVNYADGKYYLTVSSGPKSYPFALVIKNVAICDRVVYVEVQEDTANYPNQSAKNFYGCATIELSGNPDAVFVETIPAIPGMDGGEFT
ncbi:MAG: hypothetical protein MJ246_07085 [Clostridia bacterium]|nr:hypothetical protein [Clostridia bacterium]